jgi:hypothetical protein
MDASPGLAPVADTAAVNQSKLLGRWTVGLVILGILCRLTRYFLCFPIWGDEAFNCLNLIDQGYSGFLGPQRCQQVTPLLFCWGQLTAYLQLGGTELSLRLQPLLAGLAGLLLFWRLAHLTLPPLPRAIAVGFLAVAHWPISMSANIKPYALDLCMSCALLVLAVQWLQEQHRLCWLVGLVLIVPVAMLGSFPAVFVAGTIGLALLPAVWRQPDWRAFCLFAAYNALLLLSFVFSLWIGELQLHPEDTAFRQFLLDYWAHGFPPAAPLDFLRWLFLIHTGRLMAYPLGGSDGLSSLTLILFLIGLWQLWHRRQRTLLLLCLGPFALGFMAAVARRYPYGGCCRLSQHVAPIICLLAGLGCAVLIERLRSASLRGRLTWTVLGLLAVIGVGAAALDLAHPYRDGGDVWFRRLAAQIAAQATTDDQIVVLNSEVSTDVVLQWYLSRARGQVHYDACLDMEQLRSGVGQLWVLRIDGGGGLESVRATLESQSERWVLVDDVPYTYIPASKNNPSIRCELYRWIRLPSSGQPDRPALLSCWP